MTDLKDKKRESLSAVLMVKNGEKRIKDCLESVKWADEIIVVDGMSTDKTVDISKGYTTLEAEELVAKRGVISEKELRRHLVIKPLKFFWKTYVRKKAYKEGFYGLVFAIYFSFYDFLRWAKYWQIVRAEYEKKKG
jgi:hypothetical protein